MRTSSAHVFICCMQFPVHYKSVQRSKHRRCWSKFVTFAPYSSSKKGNMSHNHSAKSGTPVPRPILCTGTSKIFLPSRFTNSFTLNFERNTKISVAPNRVTLPYLSSWSCQHQTLVPPHHQEAFPVTTTPLASTRSEKNQAESRQRMPGILKWDPRRTYANSTNPVPH